MHACPGCLDPNSRPALSQFDSTIGITLMDLKNAVVVVTGGASGIGAGTAKLLAGAGCRLAILDLEGSDGATHADGLEGDAAFYPVGITVSSQVEESITEVESRFGRIDGLVNAAGYAPPLVWWHAMERCTRLISSAVGSKSTSSALSTRCGMPPNL